MKTLEDIFKNKLSKDFDEGDIWLITSALLLAKIEHQNNQKEMKQGKEHIKF